jgi:hypothetical protein
MTTRHDRAERLRARRIDAADEMLQEWATALFAIDTAINELQTPSGKLESLVATARDHVNAAVKLSVRVDLLFTVIGPTASNTTAVRDQARLALEAIEQGDANRARQFHGDSSLSQSWLVNAAGEAINSTGTRRDAADEFKAALETPEIHPEVRARQRELDEGAGTSRDP